MSVLSKIQFREAGAYIKEEWPTYVPLTAMGVAAVYLTGVVVNSDISSSSSPWTVSFNTQSCEISCQQDKESISIPQQQFSQEP